MRVKPPKHQSNWKRIAVASGVVLIAVVGLVSLFRGGPPRDAATGEWAIHDTPRSSLPVATPILGPAPDAKRPARFADTPPRAEIRENVPARPKLLPLDRSMAKPSTPTPPEDWTPPPTGEWPQNRPAKLIVAEETPISSGAREMAALMFVESLHSARALTSVSEYQLQWRRYDLKTSEPIGATIPLYPYTTQLDYPSDTVRPPLPLAALAIDGQRLAVNDSIDSRRVDVLDVAGQHRAALMPDSKAPLDWIGTGSAIYEVNGGFSAPVASCPALDWIAISTGDAFLMIDTADGRCRGRIEPRTAGGAFLHASVSGDGTRFAACRRGNWSATLVCVAPGRDRNALLDRSGLPLQNHYGADLWDLGNGESKTVAFGGGHVRCLEWTAPDHLLAVSQFGGQFPAAPEKYPQFALDRAELLDFRTAAVVAVCVPLQQEEAGRFSCNRGGRVWVRQILKDSPQRRYVWCQQQISDTADGDIRSDDRTVLNLLTQPIRVEADLGNRARSQHAADKLANELNLKGLAIGGNGSVLRVGDAVTEREKALSNDAKRFPLPVLTLTWTLQDQTGKDLWTGTTGAGFGYNQSKYAARPAFHKTGDGLDTVTKKYDSKGQDPMKAMTEEFLEHAETNIALNPAIPLGSFLAGKGRFHLLPLLIDIPITVAIKLPTPKKL